MPPTDLWVVRQFVLDDLDDLSNYGRMSDTTLTWQLVDATAFELGVTEAARLKWRQEGRGVPAVWRIQIAEKLKANGIHIELSAFDRLPPNPGRIAA